MALLFLLFTIQHQAYHLIDIDYDYLIQTKTLMSELLQIQFLKSDIDRIDNPEYFMKDFQCAQLIKFFSLIGNMKQINEKREQINLFYDRFINLSALDKNLYVQLKWIIVLHQTIQKYKQATPLFGYTLKALQLSLEAMIKFQKNVGAYEKYLISTLIKPYLQYLCKLCLLHMPEQTQKYDKKSASEIQAQTKPEEEQTESAMTKQKQQLQNLNMKLVKWYRKYNFISETLQTFQQILNEVYNFFEIYFPFLNSIRQIIIQDLNNLIFKLKYMYRSLKKSNVSIIELDQLENRLKEFNKKQKEYLEGSLDLQSKMQDFTKKDLQQFLQSPLKPLQMRLYAKKSLTSPISPYP